MRYFADLTPVARVVQLPHDPKEVQQNRLTMSLKELAAYLEISEDSLER